MESSSRHFNPRARVGRDHAITALAASIVISIHAPAWGATQFGVMRGRIATIFQSTRPRGARRSLPWNCCGTSVISIHAPAWGATRKFVGLSGVADISIHAPAWGATSNRRTSSPYAAISIHAPAWGATVPVYTGLITAVTLYFSRTSFLAVLLQAFFVAKSSV